METDWEWGPSQFPVGVYMGTKTLRQVTVNEEVFDNIVRSMGKRVVYTDDLKQYYKGYPEKKTIYYHKGLDGEFLIIREFLLDYFCDGAYGSCSEWKQVIVRKVQDQTDIVKQDTTGLYAWNYMNKFLQKYYKREEIKSIMASYKTPYNPKKIQLHFFYPHYDIKNKYYILQHKNCVKYDINGAHADALRAMFPKAAKGIESMYLLRKKNPEYKAFLNYFVGFMKRKGYEGAYNWIVQRTTDMLWKQINSVGGTLVYANTDGFIVRNPKNILPGSTNLGEFKLEYQGDVFTYCANNYMCLQYTKDGIIETTGNVRLSVRDLVDLKNKKAVSYFVDRQNNNGVYLMSISNIKQIAVEDLYIEDC